MDVFGQRYRICYMSKSSNPFVIIRCQRSPKMAKLEHPCIYKTSIRIFRCSAPISTLSTGESHRGRMRRLLPAITVKLRPLRIQYFGRTDDTAN